MKKIYLFLMLFCLNLLPTHGFIDDFMRTDTAYLQSQVDALQEIAERHHLPLAPQDKIFSERLADDFDPENITTAVKQYTQEAETASCAAFYLAILYNRGWEGQAPDKEKALTYYTNAANLGHPLANPWRSRGKNFLLSHDYKALVHHLDTKVQNNGALAYDLALFFMAQQDVSKHYEYLCIAANHHYIPGVYELGVFLLKDQSLLPDSPLSGWIPKDQARAEALLLKAAEADYVPAQFSLAAFYHQRAQPQRRDDAVKWYKKAAYAPVTDETRASIASAQINLGIMHQSKTKGPFDLAASRELLEMARDNGHDRAESALIKLKRLEDLEKDGSRVRLRDDEEELHEEVRKGVKHMRIDEQSEE